MFLPSVHLPALLDAPLQIVYGVVLILLIVYGGEVPDRIRLFADTVLGRILGVAWLFLTVESLGWLFGLFVALAWLSIVYLSPHARGVEGFEVVEKERRGRRWFVERVLGEHPVAIATDKVTTLPVQS
jgi:hypothetical protein